MKVNGYRCASVLFSVWVSIVIPAYGLFFEDDMEAERSKAAHPGIPDEYSPYEIHQDPFHPLDTRDRYDYVHHPHYKHHFYPHPHHKECAADDEDCEQYNYPHYMPYKPYPVAHHSYPHHGYPPRGHHYPEHHYPYPQPHFPPPPPPSRHELPRPPVLHKPALDGPMHVSDTETNCEWQMVFKAVAGNHRNVLEDFTKNGNLNIHAPHADELSSPIVYRNGDILDLWEHIVIPKVKVEVFVRGRRGVWFIFNGLGSTFTDWFAQDRLLASPYHDLKTGAYNFFSIAGDNIEKSSFLISRSYADECKGDCGYLAVIDNPASKCAWKSVGPSPLFVYNTDTDGCGVFSDHTKSQYGDRLVVSVNLCGGDFKQK